MKIIFTKRLIKENHTVKKLIKFVAAFDYIDKILIFLSATTGGVSICSFTSVVGAPVGIARISFTFFSNNRNSQKIIKHNEKQNEKE